LTYHPSFRDASSNVGSIQSSENGGFQMGLHANLQLSRRFDLRFYPFNLTFANQILNIKNTSDSTLDIAPLNAVTMSFPLQIRFKSDRINNFRVYSLAGIKYDRVLNGRKFSDETTIILNKSDFGIETGIGFQIFFPYFILSPEVKFNYGVSNIHKREPQDQYSALLNRISNRMIMFSLHFEGGILSSR
jgi:hypothetical protein